jgi:hypothetical protein
MDWIQSLPAGGAGFVVVGGFVALTLIVGVLVGKLAPHQMRLEHNDLAGFILAVIGVIYAVLLAFVAISVWERFESAESSTYEEAASIATVYRDAGDFTRGHELRKMVAEEVQLVMNDEWPAMAQGQRSRKVGQLLERIDAMVRSLPVKTIAQQDVHSQMLSALDYSLMDRERRVSFGATGINGVMWVVLVLGAVTTVSFTFLFGFKHRAMRYIMIGSLGFVIGLVLYLAVALDYPYKGGISVQPEAFKLVAELFQQIGP